MPLNYQMRLFSEMLVASLLSETQSTKFTLKNPWFSVFQSELSLFIGLSIGFQLAKSCISIFT